MIADLKRVIHKLLYLFVCSMITARNVIFDGLPNFPRFWNSNILRMAKSSTSIMDDPCQLQLMVEKKIDVIFGYAWHFELSLT